MTQKLAVPSLRQPEKWLKQRGMKRIIGPLSFSINEEVGLLVDGFDTPPVLMMPYGRPDYPETLENMGFTKAVDMYAYWTDMHAGYPRPKIVTTMTDYIKKDPNITVRPMHKGKFMEEVQMAMGIFNDAWSDNWGFCAVFPMCRLNIWQASLNRSSIATFSGCVNIKAYLRLFILMIPNVNEAVKGMDGKLLPFGLGEVDLPPQDKGA